MSKFDYDAVVIGGGAAGLTASGIAANFGAKTMMVEKDRLGGDCTWTGCVPSKILLKAGKVAYRIRNANKYGLIGQEPEIDFPKLIEHLHRRRREIYEEADRPEIFENMGIEVVNGTARFTGEHQLAIERRDGDRREVSSRYFFICTGGSAFVPPIDGIDEVDYLTNESLFEMDELPERLTVIGAGPVGTEMAQAFSRLGAEVTVIDMADRILGSSDPELAEMLKDRLADEGIEYLLGSQISGVFDKNGETVVRLQSGDSTEETAGDRLLVATGRRPDVEGLGLNNAGIHYTSGGIKVNDHCRTNRSHIYACGDITGRYQFTHMSEHMAKVAVTNALLKFPMKIDSDKVPRVTYTDPELGEIGAGEAQLRKQGTSFETYRFPYSKIDRALTDSESKGLIKIYARKWDGKIYGAGVLGAHAGELISEYALAMKNGISLRKMADTIHPYPTYGLGARRAADQWYIKNQSEWQVRLLKKLFGYRGEVPDFSDPDRIV